MVVLGSALQPLVPPTGMIPKQETVSIHLYLYAKISKGLMVLIVPSGNGGIDRERKCILEAETAHSFCMYVTLPHVLAVAEDRHCQTRLATSSVDQRRTEYVFLSQVGKIGLKTMINGEREGEIRVEGTE